MSYFEQVRQLYEKQAGKPLEIYKPTEPECLVQAFENIWAAPSSGIEFLVEVVHRLVYGQCLGNGNHRTTILFLQGFLDHVGFSFPHDGDRPEGAGRFEESINSWTSRSQTLIRRRGEWGFGQARLEPEHIRITREWVVQNAPSDQSEVLATIGPQRLMIFISASLSG